jgi:hypothetical protein
MSAFHFIADTNASGAHDTSIVVNGETAVSSVNIVPRIKIGKVHVSHPQFHGEVLKLAMTVGNAHGTHMVSLGEKKLENFSAIRNHSIGVCYDFHILSHESDTGWHQPGRALHFHYTESACAAFGKTVQVTQCWNVDSILAGDGQNRLVLTGRYVLVIDLEH